MSEFETSSPPENGKAQLAGHAASSPGAADDRPLFGARETGSHTQAALPPDSTNGEHDAGRSGAHLAETAQAADAGAPYGTYTSDSFAGRDNETLDDAAIGHPRVRRICRAAHIDMREARMSRWTDTVDLLSQRAPQYLQPFLAYAEG